LMIIPCPTSKDMIEKYLILGLVLIDRVFKSFHPKGLRGVWISRINTLNSGRTF
jgi:hypothetical protein